VAPFIARQERFDVVGSTNDVVRAWLAGGTPEVCLAIADRQTAGRGRDGRTWTAPARGALLLSLGFRPGWLEPERVWRLAATVSMAMADAAESAAGLPPGVIRLKWPNDLVVAAGDGVLKLAGVLGESDGLGTDDPRVVVGIGVNSDWARTDFPPALADSMTSLRDLTGGSVDHDALLGLFLANFEPSFEELREGRFDGPGWGNRQVTNGRHIELIEPDGRSMIVPAMGVDPETGALVVEDATRGPRSVLVGEIRHVRLAAHHYPIDFLERV
jgi:BirA family transcriptional regulator, biotin operon repressor / biotin---[acetyl-CoA-carboxylase] ligase